HRPRRARLADVSDCEIKGAPLRAFQKGAPGMYGADGRRASPLLEKEGTGSNFNSSRTFMRVLQNLMNARAKRAPLFKLPACADSSLRQSSSLRLRPSGLNPLTRS